MDTCKCNRCSGQIAAEMQVLMILQILEIESHVITDEENFDLSWTESAPFLVPRVHVVLPVVFSTVASCSTHVAVAGLCQSVHGI